MTSVSENPVASNAKQPTLAEATTMLLPALRQARTQLDLAIRVLTYFAPPPAEGSVSNAEPAARIRRALAAFGHPAVSQASTDADMPSDRSRAPLAGACGTRLLVGDFPMDQELQEQSVDCTWVVRWEPRDAGYVEPYQLSFLSPIAGATAGVHENSDDENSERVDCIRPLRRRRCRSLKAADVDQIAEVVVTRALLRKPNGEFIAPLYSRGIGVDAGGDVVAQSEPYEPADADTIIASAEALLAHRLLRGVKILRDPYLLLRFLRMRLVSRPLPVFAAFLLDRKQRLIRFAELAYGCDDRVQIYPREVVREVLACGAEQILCVRSDPRGDHQPTSKDIEDARRVKNALWLIEVPLVDYIVVGESVTSLVQRRVI